MTRKIRTVFQPDRVIEVSETEYLDLARQGAVQSVIVPKDTKDSDTTSVSDKKKGS